MTNCTLRLYVVLMLATGDDLNIYIFLVLIKLMYVSISYAI